MKQYVIRKNAATGRWVMYAKTATRFWWEGFERTARVTPVYAIIGNADTMENALEGVLS